MTTSSDDQRLEQLTDICLALPETSIRKMGEHTGFQVRNKTFAYFLNNHHNDGIIGVTCKAAPGISAMMVAAEPERFYRPAYLGANGWVALRLDRGDIDWDEVRALINDSYRLIAPKRLAATVAALQPTDEMPE